MNTLFICSANVGRSQIAEGYFGEKFPDEGVESAALIEDRREKYNFSPSQKVIDTMLREGIDISQQSIQLLTRDLCEQADRIILLCSSHIDLKSEFLIENIQPILFLNTYFGDKLEIFEVSDPYEAEPENMYGIQNAIKQFIQTL